VKPSSREFHFEPSRDELRQTQPVRQPRLLIRASAGTGKTFRLSSRYINLLRVCPPERILATTFTRKAAGEILERVLLRLAQAALHPEKLAELADSLDGARLHRNECLQLLAQLTEQLHRLRISTLDSHFAKLATTFSQELGLPAGWSTLEEQQLSQLREQAISSLLAAGTVQDTTQLMHLLNKGETNSSVHALISTAVERFHNLYLQAPARAWEQFPPGRLLPEAEQEVLLEQLERFPLAGREKTGRESDVERFRAGDWENFLAKGIAAKIAIGEQTYYSKVLPDALIELYHPLVKHAQAMTLLHWQQKTVATRELMARYDAALRYLKRNLRGLQFDDITAALAAGLGNQSPLAVAYRMDGQIEHLLLDEFQDTNPAQWQVLRPTARQICETVGQTFFCVGDRKQALYGWRGGEAAIFDAIERELPDIAAEPLDLSRRSSPVIMDVVNQICRGLSQHPSLDDLASAVSRWGQAFPEHSTAKKDLPGYAVLRTSPDGTIATQAAGTADSASHEEDSEDSSSPGHLAHVARYVQQLLADDPAHSIGILVRRNSTVSALIFELRRLGIPASEEGGNPLTDSAAVQLILSLMQLADHPGDSVARFHIATSPWGEHLGYTDFRDRLGAESLAASVRRDLLSMGYGEVVQRWAEQLAPWCDARELRRLQQLEDLSDQYDQQLALRPGHFVAFIEQQKVQDPQAAPVRVMTVHQSKGLEFDTVVLPELDVRLVGQMHYYTLCPEPLAPPEFVAVGGKKGDFDSLPARLRDAYQQSREKELEGSLCILYVALTRARYALHMLLAPPRADRTERTLPRTLAGLVRGALNPQIAPPPDTILFEAGNRDWFKSLSDGKEAIKAAAPTASAADPVEELPPLEIRLAEQPATATFPSLGRLPPSGQKSPRLIRISRVLQSNRATLDRGTILHAWFEELAWSDDPPPTDDLLREIATALQLNPAEPLPDSLLDECLADFRRMVAQPDIAFRLSKRAYQSAKGNPFPPAVRQRLLSESIQLEVERERSIAVPCHGQLIRGSIDRLVLARCDETVIAADILDFKTDDVPNHGGALQRRVKEYTGQLQAYVQAVQQIYELAPEQITAGLLFVTPGRVLPVPLSATSK
jgi:ATP-dependent exoDNAse (exonuclease V) beta subunit